MSFKGRTTIFFCYSSNKKHSTHSFVVIQTPFNIFFARFHPILFLSLSTIKPFFDLMPTDVNWYVPCLSYLTIDIKFNTHSDDEIDFIFVSFPLYLILLYFFRIFFLELKKMRKYVNLGMEVKKEYGISSGA